MNNLLTCADKLIENLFAALDEGGSRGRPCDLICAGDWHNLLKQKRQYEQLKQELVHESSDNS